jgi:hypothetical protein
LEHWVVIVVVSCLLFPVRRIRQVNTCGERLACSREDCCFHVRIVGKLGPHSSERYYSFLVEAVVHLRPVDRHDRQLSIVQHLDKYKRFLPSESAWCGAVRCVRHSYVYGEISGAVLNA